MNLSVNEATSEATSESDRDDDVELKVSCMVKRSQGKSTLGLTNFKTRVFVLTPSRLTYYDGSLQVGVDYTVMVSRNVSPACRLLAIAS